jgi:hypothetical protein
LKKEKKNFANHIGFIFSKIIVDTNTKSAVALFVSTYF